MSEPKKKRRPVFRIGDVPIPRGESRDVPLVVSQSYTGDPVRIPVRVQRARDAGPTVLVTALIHGDELNGIGILHEIMFESELELLRGALVLVPVVNVFGFEAQNRYMPDRRDLNREFPGRPAGSLTSRVAHVFFEQVVRKCDYCIDLHTGGAGRTNFPNVRGDLRDPTVRRLAAAFGVELIVESPGIDGTLRREATRAGVPTFILEAGETGKVEQGVTAVGVRGIRNVLAELGMIAGEPTRPPYQVRVRRSTWVRAEVGGILRFHVSPGEPVTEGQPIATNVNLFGREQNLLVAPVSGIILGMTTLPAVKPGEPVCHIAVPRSFPRPLREILQGKRKGGLTGRVRADFARAVTVTEREIEPPRPPEDNGG